MGEMSTFPTPDVLTQQQSSASTSTGQRNDELPEVQSQEGVQTSAPPASSPEETLRGAGVNEERISWAEETDTETEDEACSPAGGGTPYLLAAPRLLKSNAVSMAFVHIP